MCWNTMLRVHNWNYVKVNQACIRIVGYYVHLTNNGNAINTAQDISLVWWAVYAIYPLFSVLEIKNEVWDVEGILYFTCPLGLEKR